MPRLSTSLCIVSGPGASPLLRNLMFERRHHLRAPDHFPRQICSHLGLQEDKNNDDYPL